MDEELGRVFGIAPATVAASSETPGAETTPGDSEEISDGLSDMASLPDTVGQRATKQAGDRDVQHQTAAELGHVTVRRNLPGRSGLSSGSGFNGNNRFVFDIGHGVDTAVGGSEGRTETIQLGDGAGSIGALTTDWTLQLDNGSIETGGEGILHLSMDASGTVILGDGSQLHFHEVEHIVF